VGHLAEFYDLANLKNIMFEAIKAWPGRAKASVDDFMGQRLGFSNRQKLLTWHYLRGLWEQVLAIIPISLLQVSRRTIVTEAPRRAGAMANPATGATCSVFVTEFQS
jgi:hypothetical protein